MRTQTQFKTIKKTADKTQDLTNKFKAHLDLEFDSDDDYKEQKSLHENLVYQYLQQTQLEQALLTGLKASIQGDVIPKNPWCEVSRALGSTNLKTDIFDTFEKLAKQFRKTPTIELKEYKIVKAQYAYKQKNKILNADNEVEEVFEEQVFEVFGFHQNMEYIFVPTLKEFYYSIQNILPSFTKAFPNGELSVVNSLSAGYLLKGELIKYPNAHPKDLEINCECFVVADTLDSAFDIFSQFVFEDCNAITNKKDLHIIKEFIIYQYDQETHQNMKFSWKMKNIREVNRRKFTSDIIVNAKQKNAMYWKGYCKVQAFEYLGLTETLNDMTGKQNLNETDQTPESTAFQYIEVYKNYNLHINCQGILQSYASQPLGSLIKGVFFNERHAYRYASYFYKSNQTFMQSLYFVEFVKNQLKLVLKKWSEQNIGACAWELLYLAFYIQQADQRRELIDSIIQIVSSDYSALVSCTKYNNILRMLMELYEKSQEVLLKPIMSTVYKVYRENMMTVFGRSSGADMIRYREFIFRLLREMEDNQGGFIVNENSFSVLKAQQKVTKYMGIGNLQRVGVVTANVSQYIFDSLKKNDLIAENNRFLTYEEFQSMKVPKKMMHVSQEVVAVKQNKNAQYKKEADIEDVILLQFLNEYDLFDNLYYILRDIFFGKQLPNALPTAQFKVGTKAIKYQLFEITRQEVDAKLCNLLHEGLRKDIKDPSLEFYEYITEDMDELDLKPIYGLRQSVFYAASFEISGLKGFLDNFPWTKALKRPIPASYQVQPILSVSTIDLFHDSGVLGRTYGAWTLNWDWIIKGASYAHAQQIFIDTILKYVSWLELTSEVMVMGFFTKKQPREPYLTIGEIINAEDMMEIKQRILSSFSQGSLVYFKIIFKVETRFKCVNFVINLHFIDPSSQYPQNLLQQDIPENYIKVFFTKGEFLLWNKLYPYTDGTAIKLIAQQQKTLFYEGTLNDTMKLDLIKFFITSKVEIFLTMCRILFSYSESFDNFHKEAETMYFIFKYMDSNHKGLKQKIASADDFKDYFKDLTDALQIDLYAYDNIYFDSIGATVLNAIEGARDCFFDQQNYSSYASKMAKVSDMCSIISDSVILTYRQLLLEDYGNIILWLPKQR